MGGSNGGSLVTLNNGVENVSSVKHTGENDHQSKSSIEQPVLPKSISHIGSKLFALFLKNSEIRSANLKYHHIMSFFAYALYVSNFVASSSYSSGLWRGSHANPDHHPYHIPINGKYTVINHAAAAAAANFAAVNSPYHFHQRNSSSSK